MVTPFSQNNLNLRKEQERITETEVDIEHFIMEIKWSDEIVSFSQQELKELNAIDMDSHR